MGLGAPTTLKATTRQAASKTQKARAKPADASQSAGRGVTAAIRSETSWTRTRGLPFGLPTARWMSPRGRIKLRRMASRFVQAKMTRAVRTTMAAMSPKRSKSWPVLLAAASPAPASTTRAISDRALVARRVQPESTSSAPRRLNWRNDQTALKTTPPGSEFWMDVPAKVMPVRALMPTWTSPAASNRPWRAA